MCIAVSSICYTTVISTSYTSVIFIFYTWVISTFYTLVISTFYTLVISTLYTEVLRFVNRSELYPVHLSSQQCSRFDTPDSKVNSLSEESSAELQEAFHKVQNCALCTGQF